MAAGAPSPAPLTCVAPRGLLRSPWIVLAGFLLLYVVLDRFVAAGQPTSAIPAWDLAGGLAFCLLAIEGPLWAPAVLAADLITQWIDPRPHAWPQIVTESLTLTVTAVAAGVYLRRSGGLKFDRQSDLLRVTAAAGLAGLAQAAVAVFWRALSRSPPSALVDTLAEVWIGMALGVLLVAPLILGWPSLARRPSRWIWLEGMAQAAVLLAVLMMIYPPPPGDRFRFFYLLFLPQIWIAVRFAIPGAAVANTAVQIWMVIFAALQPEAVGPLVNYKFRVLALTASGLFLAVAVAERRLAERALFERQEQLARVSRLSLAGEMAAALAHQLNQPLAAAMAFTHAARQRLKEREPEGSPLMLAMDGAVGEVERAGGIVRALRAFVGRGEPEKRAVSLDEVVRGALALAEPECARADVRLTWTPERPIPTLAANVIEVQQVILNLVQNAVEALRGGSGPKTIAVGARRAQGGRIELEVRDSGPGVPVELVNTLFEPFTSTKAAGMGLGLLISRGIVESHGGRIWLAENGVGACAFRFTLPAGRVDASELPP